MTDFRKMGDDAWARGDKQGSTYWHDVAARDEARERKAAGGDGCSCYVRFARMIGRVEDASHHPNCGEYRQK